jgi:peptidoglycan/xylan/chitin deacetylase (PgdA/CDA1 family)
MELADRDLFMIPALSRLKYRLRRDSCRWFGRRNVTLRGSEPIISFTFDDFPRSALSTGGKILEQHGLAGTYYASLGLMGTECPTGRIFEPEDLSELVSRGHELGCHTYSHCHAWETAPADFERSIVENQQAMEKLLPGTELRTLSYPISCARPRTKRLAAKHFGCCRGAGQGPNFGTADLNYLNAFFLEQSRDNFEAIRQVIDLNRNLRGWLIFATHDISNDPTPFGCKPAFFEAVVECAARSGARVLSVSNAYAAAAQN